MMQHRGVLPEAAASPRIVGGVLKWYAGDTFRLRVEIAAVDQNGNPIEIRAGQSVEFIFYDHRGREVCRALFTDVENNSVTFVLDETASAMFPAGDYSYDVVYNGFARKTLVHSGPICVE